MDCTNSNSLKFTTDSGEIPQQVLGTSSGDKRVYGVRGDLYLPAEELIALHNMPKYKVAFAGHSLFSAFLSYQDCEIGHYWTPGGRVVAFQNVRAY